MAPASPAPPATGPSAAPSAGTASGTAATLARLLAPRTDDGELLVTPADVGGPAAFQALVRSGALRRVWGDVAAPVRVPDTPTLRALAVRAVVPRGTVLAGAAAAWVLCGAPAPRTLDLLHPPGRHRPPPHPGRAPRQAQVLRDETVLVAGVLVTSVQRTALDVATRAGTDDALATLRLLREVCGLDVKAAARSLELRHRWPGRPRARDRLALLLAADDVPV
ncbi:hypothetical protein [Cellulosimicrobium protaetiae]|uniref:AbiEi antitoxin C-terminal domain-containing protein n=1 Tax=Cellulosimicrobium protaetiae TaxID=2587808 RepID=A0A6M5UHT2_9MICO|nr:hypothetical protein [Cellulosimicrobium protaetiae]QJW36875.1 hypothetical protein FIC82_012420 [Cellulosimicrobium protaetiae]